MLSYDVESASIEEIEQIMRRGQASFQRSIERARTIVEEVRKEGDAAAVRYARKYDGFEGRSFAVPAKCIETAPSRLPQQLVSALKESARRIAAYHEKQIPEEFEFKDSCGVLGQKVVALGRVGIYAPGGTASYASSVLMAAVPARVAGVKEIILCTPPGNGCVDNSILAAANIVGIKEVYSIGGAQAVAAMAYGTETIRRVDKIVGPGGAIVTAAKQLVRKDCDIDFLAGPSEVLIIADSNSDSNLLASEMLAQLEHDTDAVAVLLSTSKSIIEETKNRFEEMAKGAGRRQIIRKAAEKGAIFLRVRSLQQALQVSNDFAPEHLVIDTREPWSLLDGVKAAGSVFLGRWSSVAFGDYCSGTNHVLPTMGMARSSSALSVSDFVKIVPYQQITRKGAGRLAPIAVSLAEAEGLTAHASAAKARIHGGDE
ncbi:MAG: histidinol dehydrogenase [Methanobacteriota archaeon]|nr:MAG: histidinol dehydrogenase [Euryarchaeota archaeon]